MLAFGGPSPAEREGAIWLASEPAPLDRDDAERVAERLELPLTWPRMVAMRTMSCCSDVVTRAAPAP